jgi:hypothetical protein
MSIPLMEIELKVFEALREDFKRNQWCEKMKATVRFFAERQEWGVEWRDRGECNCFDPDRDTAIDKARGAK